MYKKVSKISISSKCEFRLENIFNRRIGCYLENPTYLFVIFGLTATTSIFQNRKIQKMRWFVYPTWKPKELSNFSSWKTCNNSEFWVDTSTYLFRIPVGKFWTLTPPSPPHTSPSCHSIQRRNYLPNEMSRFFFFNFIIWETTNYYKIVFVHLWSMRYSQTQLYRWWKSSWTICYLLYRLEKNVTNLCY